MIDVFFDVDMIDVFFNVDMIDLFFDVDMIDVFFDVDMIDTARGRSVIRRKYISPKVWQMDKKGDSAGHECTLFSWLKKNVNRL